MPEQIKSNIMDASGMERTLTRLAHQIIEQNRGLDGLALIGIRTRGAPLAYRLAKLISNIGRGEDVPVGILDITLHRDDFLTDHKTPTVRATDIPFDIHNQNIILIDDVLFTGRTIRSAIEATMDYGRPARIQLAVLVDRGHREMPIQGDFIGEQIVTAPGQTVQVHVTEIDGCDEVLLMEQS